MKIGVAIKLAPGYAIREDTVLNHDSTYKNAIAKDIEEFKTSAINNKGFYIGRYEARTTNSTARQSGTELTKMTTIKTNAVYNYITQYQASQLSQEMYEENTNFTSDLINSYAWSAAIVFLQTFDNRVNKIIPYSLQTSLNNSLAITGTDIDIICNVYDVASNCREFTTESGANYSAVFSRGGSFNRPENVMYYSYESDYTKSDNYIAFRPILYL